MRFLDTNILLYAFESGAPDRKYEIAESIISAGNIAFSIQVFQEFFVQATHQRRIKPLTEREAKEIIDLLSVFPVQVNNFEVFNLAYKIMRSFKISFWDSNIIAAARTLNCETIYSEDLNHGQDYGGIKVINPFVEES